MITTTLVFSGPNLTTRLSSGAQVITTLSSSSGNSSYTTILSTGLVGPPGPPGPTPDNLGALPTDPIAYYILSRD